MNDAFFMNVLKCKLRAVLTVGLLVLLCSCRSGFRADQQANETMKIFPDYRDVTIPVNISPLNFNVPGAESVYVEVTCQGKTVMQVTGDGADVKFPVEEWRQVLADCAGKTMELEVSVVNDRYPQGVRYAPFSLNVSADTIDPYLVYRLIEPGYESWRDMRICQRSVTDFEERKILETNQKACINCHSFSNYSSNRMLLHVRGAGGGTLILDHGKMKKVDFKAMKPGKQGVYPMWHPSGKYVAFSSNKTCQSFYVTGNSPIEVYDSVSDLIIYDVEKDKVLTDKRFCGDRAMETFPAWSPDGRYLYYCVADFKVMPDHAKDTYYSLCRVKFDVHTGKLADEVDTVVLGDKKHGSVSLPRISPDGRYLLYTRAANSTFPIWHIESDLNLIDLKTGQQVDTRKINSSCADSYHSWSSNGRWIVFSSRRIDGRYTRLFIAHFDGRGNWGRPFLLPQITADQNILRLESYNIPEFVKDRLEIDQRGVESLFDSSIGLSAGELER